MKLLNVSLEENPYDILICDGILKEAGRYIRKVYTGTKIMIVTDTNVFKYHFDTFESSLKNEGFETSSYVLEAGEKSKSMETLPKLYTAFLEANITRTDLIVALGGGVVGDIVGFAAATYLRGTPYVQVPTSLLAQVDSSVGGKVAADLEEGKNLVGVFYQPKMVIIDPTVLQTLEERYYIDGMGEVIKYACLFSEEFFEKLLNKNISETDIIYECCKFKRDIVLEDEKDLGNRMLLNFGHTLGHAIEKYFGFEKYSHGEGVAIGMYEITKIAEKKGLTKEGTADKIKEILVAYKLPYETPNVSKEEIIKTIAHDKKNLNDKLNVVLLNEIGSSYLYETTPEFFKDI